MVAELLVVADARRRVRVGVQEVGGARELRRGSRGRRRRAGARTAPRSRAGPTVARRGQPRFTAWRRTRTPRASSSIERRRGSRGPWRRRRRRRSRAARHRRGTRRPPARARPVLKQGTITATRGCTIGKDDGDAETYGRPGGWGRHPTASLHHGAAQAADARRGPSGAGHRAAPAARGGLRARHDRDRLAGRADRGRVRQRRRVRPQDRLLPRTRAARHGRRAGHHRRARRRAVPGHERGHPHGHVLRGADGRPPPSPAPRRRSPPPAARSRSHSASCTSRTCATTRA